MGTKVVLVVAIVAVIGGGVYYYFFSNSPAAESVLEQMESITESMTGDSSQDRGDIPAADDSVEGFEAAVAADLEAEAQAVGALDSDVDGSVQSVNSDKETYNPNEL